MAKKNDKHFCIYCGKTRAKSKFGRFGMIGRSKTFMVDTKYGRFDVSISGVNGVICNSCMDEIKKKFAFKE